MVKRTKLGENMEESLRHKRGGGELWRQLVEGDMEERICVCGRKTTHGREDYYKQTLF